MDGDCDVNDLSATKYQLKNWLGCVRSGVVSEDNVAIVRAKSCLKASRQETVARKAARDLFASLSNGKQYITTAQLERKIREICNVTLNRDAGEESSNDESPGEADGFVEADEADVIPSLEQLNGAVDNTLNDYPEPYQPQDELRNLTVDNLVNAAVDYCQGELPLLSYDLTLTDPNTKALDHIPILHRAFIQPKIFIQILYLKLLFYFSTFSLRLSNTDLELLPLLVAYLVLNREGLTILLPLLLYYTSFIAMVVCTFRMLYAKRQFVDFRKWSGLFLRYSEGNLHPDESENLFVRNNLPPFLHFFAALFINLFIYPFVSTQWVPFSEFCVVSFVLMFLTIFSFCSDFGSLPDLLPLLSFGINVLAKYPYEKDTVVHQGWRFLELHTHDYVSYLFGNSIEFCLNARVFFSLLVPVILVLMARRNNWRGFIQYTIPHCVTLSWLQLFIICSQGCTTYGLVRGTLGLVCSFLFLPLIGVVTLTLPIFAFLQYVTMSKVVFTASLILALGVSLGVTCVLAKLEATKKFVTPLQLAIGLLAILYFGNKLMLNVQDEGLPTSLIDLIAEQKSSIKNLLKNEFVTDFDENYQITWEEYYKHCNIPAWSESNMAEVEIKCSVLQDTHIDWEGYVKEVKLLSVTNSFNDVTKWLPGFLQEYFKCYYGEEYMNLCSDDELFSEQECDFIRNVARQSGKSCHLENLNEYTFEITLSMETGGGLLAKSTDVHISFDHQFTNITRLLRTDDRIGVKGVLKSQPGKINIGNRDLLINGYEINCVKCKNARGTITSKDPVNNKMSAIQTLFNDCMVSAKYILNLLLNPVIVLK